jgi:hypothetical protein
MNRLRINKIGVLSFAKIYGAILATVALVISIPYGLFVIFIGVAALGGGAREAAPFGFGGIVGGLAIMILLPVFYGLVGFIFGALGAFIYNIFAGFVGGVEVDVENIF